jgi:hypothetical protein
MPRRILIALAALGALALPSAAMASTQTSTQTAHDGQVTAKLTYSGQVPQQKNVKLSITRAGETLYAEPVTSKFCNGLPCEVGQGSVQALDIDHSGEPDVVLSLFTGGAHCCSVAQVFVYDPGTQTYRMAQRNFGDPGFRIESLAGDGTKQFVTANDAFAYRFTDFAASGLPVQVLQLNGTTFSDATNSYPALVRKDAAQWLTAYKRMARSGYTDSVGVIAAWAADEGTLGRGAQALTYVKAQARAGHLNTTLAPVEKGGMAFVTRLQAFLKKQGYTS